MKIFTILKIINYQEWVLVDEGGSKGNNETI